MDIDSGALGMVIRKLRKDRAFTQEKLAELAGIGRSHLTEIENGLKDVRISTLCSIAKALDVRTSELMRIAEEEMR